MTDFENQVIERLTQLETTLMALIHALTPEFDDVDEEAFITSLDGETFNGTKREPGQTLD